MYVAYQPLSLSHKPGGLGVFLDFSVCGDDIGGHSSKTSNLPSHNHNVLYSVHPSLPQDSFHKVGVRRSILKTVFKAISYIYIKIILIILIQACHHNLIQSCHYTLFVHVHISHLILHMHLIELHIICIYHPFDFYIIHHPFFVPPSCH